MYRTFAKWLLELILTILGLVLLSPALVVIAILVRLVHGSPVMFTQRRPGRHGKPFTLYKFRTMTNARSADGHLLPDAERLTSLGRFLRRTSLDELPELLNVLKGDMSLVGPRPLLVEYLDRYTPEQNRRHEVRPGITGWAQIRGRQTLMFSKRIEYDVWYVDHCSLWLDLRILVLTVFKAISGRGVISGQDVQDVDDLGLSKSSPTNRSE